MGVTDVFLSQQKTECKGSHILKFRAMKPDAQDLSLKLGKGRFYRTDLWPQFSSRTINFEQAPLKLETFCSAYYL